MVDEILKEYVFAKGDVARHRERRTLVTEQGLRDLARARLAEARLVRYRGLPGETPSDTFCRLVDAAVKETVDKLEREQ